MSDDGTDLAAFAARLPGKGALMGLDPGTKTIGIAVSDTGRAVASPLETRRRGKFAADAVWLAERARARAIAGIVVGLPLNMDGSAGPRARSARAFGRNLARALDLPVAFWDERLSTVAAERALSTVIAAACDRRERALLEADTSRRRRTEVIDHVAAAIILQGALDRLAAIGRSE
jgi:putative Holliday junction resolvase